MITISSPLAPPVPAGDLFDAPIATFPDVIAETITGHACRLPDAFIGQLNLVIVAFWRDQRIQVDSWAPELVRLQADHRGLARYDLPVIAESYLMCRSGLEVGLSRGFGAADPCAGVMTLYTDKAAFRRKLGLEGEDTIHLLLLDRAGRVLWRTAGPFDPAPAAELRRHVAAHLPRAQ